MALNLPSPGPYLFRRLSLRATLLLTATLFAFGGTAQAGETTTVFASNPSNSEARNTAAWATS